MKTIKNQKTKNHISSCLRATLVIAAFTMFGAVAAGSGLIPGWLPDGNAKTPIDPSEYAVSITSTDIISLSLETVPYTNVIRAGTGTVTASITAPAGTSANFRLYLSTDTASSALTNGTDSIPATSGTLEAPTALTGNAWGFALASGTTGIPTNGFDASYATPDPGTASKWAGVPAHGSEQLIQTLPMNQSSTTTDVYYAVSAKDDLSEGMYTGNVIYTAVYNASETNEATISPTSGTTGTEITITTAAVTSMSDIGDVTVNLTDSSGTATLCENPTATVLATGQVQVTCTVPTLPDTGNYTVTATLDKTGVTYTGTQPFAYTKPAPFTISPQYIPVGNSDTHNITITGENFTGVTSVKLGDADCTNINVKSDTELTCDIGQSATISDETTDFYEAGISSSNATMQSMTPTIKNNVSAPLDKTVTITTNKGSRDADVVYYQEVTLKDTRDDKTYYISKLADGKCWMTQNLDLDLSTSTTLTSDDTNLTTVSDWTPSASTLTNVSSWTDNYNNPVSLDIGEEYIVSSGTTSNDTTYNSLSACTGAGHSESTCKHSHTGNLYNWTAAVAENNSSDYSTDGTSAPSSICPKGWRLPSGNSADPSEFGLMLKEQGIISNATDTSYASDGFNNIRTSPLYWVRAGLVRGGSRDFLGSHGPYWSSTVDDSYYAYHAFFTSSVIAPRDGVNRDFGSSVRCLAL